MIRFRPSFPFKAESMHFFLHLYCDGFLPSGCCDTALNMDVTGSPEKFMESA